MPTGAATDQDGCCPSCHGKVLAITSSAPGEHVIQPCGHRAGEDFIVGRDDV